MGYSYYADAQKAFSEGRYEDIIELCSKEVNDDNSSHLAEALLLRATFYMLQGEADKAKEDFARLLDLANVSKAVIIVECMMLAVVLVCGSSNLGM